jgi:exopolysaccharide biosynthesis polyprenyl glycosylphosphotransferase
MGCRDMFRRFSVNFALLSITLDAFFVIISFLAAVHMRPLLNIFPFAATISRPMQTPSFLYPFFAFWWVLINLLLSIYDGRKNLYFVNEFTSLTIGAILTGVSLAGVLYLSYRDISRLLFLIFIALGFILMLIWRTIARYAFRVRRGSAIQQRKVLIVGAGPVGRKIQYQIEKFPYMGLTSAGFLDDDPNKLSLKDDILGSLKDARLIVNQYSINDIVIALPQRAHQRINQLVAELHDLPVKVWVVPDYFHLALHKAVVEEFAGLPMLDLRAPALNDYQRMIKRAFDIFLSVLLFIPASIIMLVIAIAIRIEGKGPVIFHQKRVGENGRIFEMLKFRTMVDNAEKLRHLVEHYDENGNLIHKVPEDPRVTRVGKFLRKTSLDELPQLFNILKGEMSLVGPRPELPYLVKKYQPWQRKRFAVPPGITGWWQVNGRSDRPMHLHTEDDLYYVQNYSLLLDLEILFKTILVVVRGRGAY